MTFLRLCVPVVLISAALILSFWLVDKDAKHKAFLSAWNQTCDKRGGVLVETTRSYVCIRRDALILLED